MALIAYTVWKTIQKLDHLSRAAVCQLSGAEWTPLVWVLFHQDVKWPLWPEVPCHRPEWLSSYATSLADVTFAWDVKEVGGPPLAPAPPLRPLPPDVIMKIHFPVASGAHEHCVCVCEWLAQGPNWACSLKYVLLQHIYSNTDMLSVKWFWW